MRNYVLEIFNVDRLTGDWSPLVTSTVYIHLQAHASITRRVGGDAYVITGNQGKINHIQAECLVSMDSYRRKEEGKENAIQWVVPRI